MMSRFLSAIAASMLIVCAFAISAAQAQQPSASAIATAREVLETKGGLVMFEPIVPGVIETAKNVFVQQSPNLQKDLNEVAAALRTSMAPRTNELKNEIAKTYAQNFSEPELKELLVFFKTPIGKKLITQEALYVEQALTRAQDWGNRLSDEVMSKIRAEMKKKGHNL